MSAHIGTNFSLKAKEFLDKRQGEALTEKDLKDWNIPVPEGFEVCIGTSWYYYKSDASLEKTGHWVPRVAKSLEESGFENQAAGAEVVKLAFEENKKMLEDLQGSLKELDATMNPPKFNSINTGSSYGTGDLDKINKDKEELISAITNCLNQGIYNEKYDLNDDGVIDSTDLSIAQTTYDNVIKSLPYISTGTDGTCWIEVGATILPKFSWDIGKGNKKVVPKSVVVTGPTKGYLEDDLSGWTSKTGLTSDTAATKIYNISVVIDEYNKASSTAKYKFGYKLFYGTGAESLVTSGKTIKTSELPGFNSYYTESGLFSKKSFNCSGGKYPYILIPKAYYSASNKIYVGGFLNSDFNVIEFVIVNPLEVKIPYIALRTGSIQNGSAIPIQISNS